VFVPGSYATPVDQAPVVFGCVSQELTLVNGRLLFQVMNGGMLGNGRL
jgi:hypothetical protein